MTFAMIRGRVWRKRRKRRFAEEVDTSAAAARSTSSTAASCAPISLRPEGRTCVAAGGGDELQACRCASAVCAAAAKDCADAGKVGEGCQCQVDWGSRDYSIKIYPT